MTWTSRAYIYFHLHFFPLVCSSTEHLRSSAVRLLFLSSEDRFYAGKSAGCWCSSNLWHCGYSCGRVKTFHVVIAGAWHLELLQTSKQICFFTVILHQKKIHDISSWQFSIAKDKNKRNPNELRVILREKQA